MTSGDKPTGEVSRPGQLIVPCVSEAVRDTMVADVGTLIYNVTDSELNVCMTKVAGAGSWQEITSA